MEEFLTVSVGNLFQYLTILVSEIVPSFFINSSELWDFFISLLLFYHKQHGEQISSSRPFCI